MTSTSTAAREGDLDPHLGPRTSLVVYHRDGAEVALFLPDVPVVVGRSSQADLRVRDGSISARHARFTLSNGCVTVEDLGSTNGTWLRGKRIERAELRVGDEIAMGSAIGHIHAQGPVRRSSEAGLFSDSPRPPSGVVRSVPQGVPAGRGGALLTGAVMRGLMETVNLIASSRLVVLLLGETGTGKEVLAHLIHDRGPRKARRLIAINCGALPEQLVEGTLFGHERGAFSGAHQTRRGVFEEADGGTVLLDEIGELPLTSQVKLLRVLQDGSFCRVGGVRERVTDVRVIAATNRNLEAMVRDRRFREDLYFRLSTFPIHIPPLRERVDEIEPLAWHFLRMANAENPATAQGIDPEALAKLRAYAWPGNVRELENAIKRAAALAREPVLVARDLPLGQSDRVVESTPASTVRRGAVPPVSEPPAPELSTPANGPANGAGEIRPLVRQYEIGILTEALAAVDWKVGAAARSLHIPPRTLRDKMTKLGIKKPS